MDVLNKTQSHLHPSCDEMMEPVAPVLPSSSGLVQRAHDASDMRAAGYQKCAKFAEQPNQLLEKHEACMCATQQWVSSAGPQVGPTQATCSYSTIGFELHGLKISCQSLFTCNWVSGPAMACKLLRIVVNISHLPSGIVPFHRT